MKKIASILVVVALIATTSVATAAEVAGVVSRLQGSATATAAGVSRPLAANGEVFPGDQIATGKDSRLEIRMADGAVITLGDDGLFTIGGIEPEKRGRVYGLFQGVFLAVSGKLADGRTSKLTILTPVATVGIRGTTFWGSQSPDLFEIVLLDGTGVYVESAGRRVVLTRPESGTRVEVGRAPTKPSPWEGDRLNAAKATVAFR
jgi:hypothetical protein